MGANHSPGEKLITIGLAEDLIDRIDAVRKPVYKSRSGFFRAAVVEKLQRMEAEARIPHPKNRIASDEPFSPVTHPPAALNEPEVAVPKPLVLTKADVSSPLVARLRGNLPGRTGQKLGSAGTPGGAAGAGPVRG